MMSYKMDIRHAKIQIMQISQSNIFN